VPGELTEVTELATAVGMLGDQHLNPDAKPVELQNVSREVWDRVMSHRHTGQHAVAFRTAFENGAALLDAEDGLRGRRPRLIEWKGPHRPPGDDVIPADLRIDHVYLVSCKHLSRVMLNAGPARLFDRLLIGEERSAANWFEATAQNEFVRFYEATCALADPSVFPPHPNQLTAAEQRSLRALVAARSLPESVQPFWQALAVEVSTSSAERWRAALTSPRAALRMLWRLLRISNATYFVLGTDRTAHLRLRVASMWDWHQAFELRAFSIVPRIAGQPEVAWKAEVRNRTSGVTHEVNGHVEVRWSHGRFVGHPEAKVYLDTAHTDVPGYYPLR
jgi:hypothetical protein